MALFDEAVRTIPGYDRYNPDKEVKDLIDYKSTKDNYVIKINDYMVLRGKRYTKRLQFIEELVTEKLGKAPRKDATACSLVFTLPRNYMAGHDFGLTEEEHTALQKSFEKNRTPTSICCGYSVSKINLLEEMDHFHENLWL